MDNVLKKVNLNRVLVNSLVMSALLNTHALATEVGGVLKAQSSYQAVSNEWQRHDWQMDIELNTTLAGGDVTGITRFLFDAQSKLNHRESSETYGALSSARFEDKHNLAEIRELYWEYQGEQVYWKLGKQQVVWGEADGLKLLDVINPQSYREFILDDFDDSRIPLWMFNGEIPLGDDSLLQVLWMPDTSTHDLAPPGSPYELRSELLVPQAVPGVPVNLAERKAPKKVFKDSDVGIRLSHYYGGWDMTFNYLYHYVDEPVLRAEFDGSVVNIEQSYERSHLVGGSVSNAFGDWTLRAELAYETNRYHRSQETLTGVLQANQWGSVIGLDYQGWSDQFVSVQWFQTRILTNSQALVKSKTEEVASLLWELNFLNDTLTFSWLNLHSLDRHDGVSRPKVKYNLLSNLDLTLGYDRFYGEGDGLFGQFDQTDRVSFGFELGFN